MELIAALGDRCVFILVAAIHPDSSKTNDKTDGHACYQCGDDK